MLYVPTSTDYKTGLDFTQQFPNGILSFGSLWFPHYVAKVPWQLWHIWICWLTIIENIMTKCTSLLNQIWQNLVFSTRKAHMPIFHNLFPENFRFYLSMKDHFIIKGAYSFIIYLFKWSTIMRFYVIITNNILWQKKR